MLPDNVTAARALEGYLRMLAGERPRGRLLELRYPGGGRMRQRFIPAQRPESAAKAVLTLSARVDVYTGVLLRRWRAGGRDAVCDSHLVFVETDSPDGQARLQRFAHQPTMLIASGSGPGHLHAYWWLRDPIAALELEHANRTLAHHLGADPACVDAARILRPPSSLNHKHAPPKPVRLVEWRVAKRFTLAELLAGLRDAPGLPARGPAGPRRVARHPLDELLLAVPGAEYARVLAGREPDRQGKIHCPFHDDSDPSLQLYEDGSWFCFGCRQGGSVYDFAALLWGQETKGRAFPRLRALIAERLGIEITAACARTYRAT